MWLPGLDSMIRTPPTIADAAPASRAGRAAPGGPAAGRGVGVEAAAVVLHDGREVAAVPPQDDADPARRGVLGDVGEGLLEDPVDGRLDLRREARRPPGLAVELDGDPGPRGPLVQVVGQGRASPMSSREVGRSSTARRWTSRPSWPATPGARRSRSRRRESSGTRAPGHFSSEGQGRQLLADLVVQLARDPPPLVLLDRHQPAEQLQPRLLGRRRSVASRPSDSRAAAARRSARGRGAPARRAPGAGRPRPASAR